MNSHFDLEYYPKINPKIIERNKQMIISNRGKWESPFFTDTTSYLDLAKIESVAKEYANDKIKNVIVLGTGGSVQTLLALKHLAKKKLYHITSSRAVELKDCLDSTNPEESIVIPISRGGETLDVNSTIGTFLKNDYNFLGLSSKGTMYEILSKIGCPILEVPDLSGRFAGSVSNVGMLPSFILGININEFLKGLNDGYEKFMGFKENPALEFSSFLYGLYLKGYKIVFSMPYSITLEGSIGLFVQEISESTGKNEKGLIGTYQSAPLCQHSVLEYLLGGKDFPLSSSIEYVNNKSAQTVVNYQADATFQALLDQGVPTAKISVAQSDEYSIGILISFIQSSIYNLCLLLDVNWSNNPKVIIGKEIGNKYLKETISPAKRKDIRKNLAMHKFQQDFYKVQ
ncbi:MAG: hypothetical protein ACTSPS_14645 [Promethearchaeota archaeon]